MGGEGGSWQRVTCARWSKQRASSDQVSVQTAGTEVSRHHLLESSCQGEQPSSGPCCRQCQPNRWKLDTEKSQNLWDNIWLVAWDMRSCLILQEKCQLVPSSLKNPFLPASSFSFSSSFSSFIFFIFKTGSHVVQTDLELTMSQRKIQLLIEMTILYHHTPFMQC